MNGPNPVTASDALHHGNANSLVLHYALLLAKRLPIQRSSAAQTSMRTTNRTGAEHKNSSSRSRIIRPLRIVYPP